MDGVSVENRRAAWDLFCKSDYQSRYWSIAHQRLLRQGRWWAVVQVTFATGAFGVALATLPNWAFPMGQALLAVVAVCLLVKNPLWKLAEVKAVRDQCGRIESKARRLWHQIESGRISDETAADLWYDLQTDLDDATSKVEMRFNDDDVARADQLSDQSMESISLQARGAA